jgi:hypothetical protein
MVVLTPEMGVAFQFRPAAGANMVHIPANFPISAMNPTAWIRVVRAAQGAGFSFTGFVSPDGVKWQQIGSAIQVVMTANALGGLAVTAHNDPPSAKDRLDELCVAVFDHVSVQ